MSQLRLIITAFGTAFALISLHWIIGPLTQQVVMSNTIGGSLEYPCEKRNDDGIKGPMSAKEWLSYLNSVPAAKQILSKSGVDIASELSLLEPDEVLSIGKVLPPMKVCSKQS